MKLREDLTIIYSLLGKFLFLALSACLSQGVIAGNMADTLRLDEVTIESYRSPDVYSKLSRILTVIDSKEIERIPGNTIQDILEYSTTADVRQRGPHGVQADLSIRGGSFEQVLVLLNGVKINDPQTGHHTLNIPVDAADIERIEILEGPGSRIYGPNAFSGAVNIVTRQPDDASISGYIEGGQYRLRKVNLSGSLPTGPLKSYGSFSTSSSDGFTDNTDFKHINLFYRGLMDISFAEIDLQAGYIEKGFGANSFYSALYPDQYEKINSTFANISVTTGEVVRYTHSAYIRRHYDRFELFRYDSPPWYDSHNYHMTDLYGTNAQLSIPWSAGSFSFGGELRSEQIYSTVLGEEIEKPRPVKNHENTFYNHFKRRDQINFSGNGTIIVKNMAASTGLLLNKTDTGGWKVFYGTDLSYRFNSTINWIASYNSSLRLPSFTEMYYKSPVHRSNPELEPEEAKTLETGIKYAKGEWRGHMVVFNRKGSNIIDWVKQPDEMVWQSSNITRLNSYGFDVEIIWRNQASGHNLLRELRGGYSFLDVSKKSQNYISAYLLDHLKHKLIASAVVSPAEPFELFIRGQYQNRAGTFTEITSGKETGYDPFFIFDAGISSRINKHLIGSLTASNLMNKNYSDIGNVPLPGRWLKATIKFEFPGG